MVLNLQLITSWLEIEDGRIVDLKNSIMATFGNPQKMRPLIDRQCENREQTHCLSCESESGCLILNGIVYLELGEIENAIREIESANRHFRNKNETLNQIIGLVLLGQAYEDKRKDHLALREYEQAQNVLGNYRRIHANDYLTKAEALKDILDGKISELSESNFSGNSSPAGSVNTNPNQAINAGKDFLALFSIPIYGTVEAGLDGTLHIDHFNIFTIINQVELKKQLYDVYNVHGTAEADRQITITTKREHGWLRVHGLSMNDWDLPFSENDYVLFYKSQTASHHDFVIASNTDPSGEIDLMVKRFDAEKNQLVSKSKDKSKPYGPIPVDERHQIVGIVIAIAKPAK
ncbi:MAG: S24 family peptidase [Chloroflexota bacterium]